MIYRGKVWKFGDDVSTDLIMPNIVVFTKCDMSDQEASKYTMRAIRPNWIEQVQTGDIIVAGKNFGCGSSRPAPRMLKDLGIAVVVADSISRLFFRNSIHVGFPIVICPGVSQAFEEGDIAEVNVENGEVTNLTRNTTLQGETLPKDSPPYKILIAGGIETFIKEDVNRMKEAL